MPLPCPRSNKVASLAIGYGIFSPNLMDWDEALKLDIIVYLGWMKQLPIITTRYLVLD